MQANARPASAVEILPLRTRHRQEMNCQIVHDSIHRRPGWTLSYLLHIGDTVAGFGSVAVGGPWKEKPALFEFYVLPEFRTRAFDLFESLLGATGARFIEIQSNDALLAVMLFTCSREIASEKIVFHDHRTTDLAAGGANLRCVTSDEDVQRHIEARQGGTEWRLELHGEVVGQGGILFHYNPPYGDIYMEVNEPFRKRGFGAYLVQELKRIAYDLGAVPCARCSPENFASRRTLQKAGFVPFAHMLTGTIGSESMISGR
jgi:GNAT superfamily N-acetyltransferase